MLRARPLSTRSTRALVAAASFAGMLVTARVASAQNVTLSFSSSQPNPTWLDSSGNVLNGGNPLRQMGNNPYGASFSDCENDYQMEFSLAETFGTSGVGADTLQVWAGTADCSMVANRSATQSGTCVPVTSVITLNSLTFNVPIYVRDLAMAIGGVSPSSVGNETAFTSIHDKGDGPCFRQSGSAAIAINIYFNAFTSGGSTVDTFINYNAPLSTGGAGSNGISMDFVGPPAPSGGTIGVGDTELIINWSPADDSDTAGFQVLCDPVPGTAADSAPPIDAQCSTANNNPIEDSSTTGDDSSVSARILVDEAGGDDAADDEGDDAATTNDSGLDASTATCNPYPDFDAAVCGNSPLLNTNSDNGGQIPAYYYCGPQIQSATATTYTPTQLADGTYYTIAVAGYDLSENLGAVYVIGCAAPQPIRDFWTTYRQDGGGAGGAFCALDAVGMPVGSTVFVGTFAVGAFGLIRRRRRRAR